MDIVHKLPANHLVQMYICIQLAERLLYIQQLSPSKGKHSIDCRLFVRTCICIELPSLGKKLIEGKVVCMQNTTHTIEACVSTKTVLGAKQKLHIQHPPLCPAVSCCISFSGSVKCSLFPYISGHGNRVCSTVQ